MVDGSTLDDRRTPSAALTRARVRWFLACGLLGALLGGAAAYAVTPLLPRVYTAESHVVVRAPSQVTVFDEAPAVNATAAARSAAQVLRSPEVSALASSRLGGRLSAAEVHDRIELATAENSPVITIEATASTADLARDLADALPAAYLSVDAGEYRRQADETARLLEELRDEQEDRLEELQNEVSAIVTTARNEAAVLTDPTANANFILARLQSDPGYLGLQREVDHLTARLGETDDALDRLEVDTALLESGADLVIPAELPDEPAGPGRLEIAAVGALIGILLGALAAWRAVERRRTLDPATVADALGAPVLGCFGPARQLRRFPRFADLSESPGAELTVLASSLLLSARRHQAGALVVTSARRREGRSTLAAHLAAAADATGHPVVLVDADPGPGSVTDAFGLSDRPGLAEILDGGPLANSLHPVPYAEGRSVPVVPGGPAAWHPAADWRTAWDAAFPGPDGRTAVVDAPPVNDHPLALELAGAGVLVVVVSPRTTIADLELLRNRTEGAGAEVLGFVLNEVRVPRRRRTARPRDVDRRPRGADLTRSPRVPAGTGS